MLLIYKTEIAEEFTTSNLDTIRLTPLCIIAHPLGCIHTGFICLWSDSCKPIICWLLWNDSTFTFQ